jgi:dTDP-L-rhamnose 4-epimerase
MYTVRQYEEVNVGGTATLLDILVNGKAKSISRIVVASSRAVYGEGAYRCNLHDRVFPGPRSVTDMRSGNFEPLCPSCKSACEVIETSEDTPFSPSSWYGLTKQVQEQMVLMFGRTLGISAHALRYQNVYGPGQSLKNPYTGILAIFSSQARLNEPIMIFEDGKESRDFVYVEDVADATFRALSAPDPACTALNVGSGKRVTVLEVVRAITDYFGSSSDVSVNGAFREGDIRHCVADITRIKESLGFSPKWNFVSGVRRFLSWTEGEEPSKGSYSASLEEISRRGLLHA